MMISVVMVFYAFCNVETPTIRLVDWLCHIQLALRWDYHFVLKNRTNVKLGEIPNATVASVANTEHLAEPALYILVRHLSHPPFLQLF